MFFDEGEVRDGRNVFSIVIVRRVMKGAMTKTMVSRTTASMTEALREVGKEGVRTETPDKTRNRSKAETMMMTYFPLFPTPCHENLIVGGLP